VLPSSPVRVTIFERRLPMRQSYRMWYRMASVRLRPAVL